LTFVAVGIVQAFVAFTSQRIAISWVKIIQKDLLLSVFLTIWHCILGAELTNKHSFRLTFGDFAHWAYLWFSMLEVILCEDYPQINNTKLLILL